MKLSFKQRKIIDFIRVNGSISVKEAQSIPGVNTYYCNAAKHCGGLLRNMEKRGFIARIKKGVYHLPENGKISKQVSTGTINQQSLNFGN